jgi:hypothetical protein
MSTHSPAIVAPESYRRALLALRDKNLPSSHFLMLRTQCRATGATITATQLAEAAGYENYQAANLQYGTLASNVAKLIGFRPETRADGTPMWWTTLSYSLADHAEAHTGHFQFIMRLELATALHEMRWA